MAAGTWKSFTRTIRNISTAQINLSAGIYKMCLHRASASASLLLRSNGAISVWASVPGEISARGGYVAAGRRISAPGFTVGDTALRMKFRYTTAGIVFTASDSALNNIKYAVIRNSTGAGAGKVIAFCTLSTAAFTIASGNTLTILPNAAGVFYLA